MALSDFYADRQAFNNLVQGQQNSQLAKRAGAMMAGGNTTAARDALYTGGQLDAGMKLQGEIDADHKREVEFAGNFATGIAKRLQAGQDPETAWREGEQWAAGQGMADHLPTLRQRYDAMGPEAFTSWLGSAAAKEYQLFQNDSGIYGVNKADPSEVVTAKSFAPEPLAMDPDKNYYLPDDGSVPQTSPIVPGINGDAPPTNVEETWRAMIQRESGGVPGRTGPQTPYGQAQGIAQVLPATGKEMAAKLGIPWRPDLMTAKTPEAAAYQERIGRAYYDEGLQKYGGDPSKAAMYYHGGPNEALWGPKTRAYAGAVAGPQMARNDLQPPNIPGYRQIQRAQPKQEDAPSGYRWNAGKLEFIPGGPADPAGKADEGRLSAKELRQGSIALRKEFDQHPDVKAFQTVATQYDIIHRLGTAKPTAANDMSMIFAYMKVLDPTSVVREGEFANAQNTAGIPDRVRNAYNKALNGQRLNDTQRGEFIESAGRIYEANKSRYDQMVSQYQGYATQMGLPDGTIQARGAVGKPGGTGGAGGDKAGGDFSPAQRATAQQLAQHPQFKRQPPGSQVRPFAPRSEAEFRGIKPGSWYIDDDGQVYQKGR